MTTRKQTLASMAYAAHRFKAKGNGWDKAPHCTDFEHSFTLQGGWSTIAVYECDACKLIKTKTVVGTKTYIRFFIKD